MASLYPYKKTIDIVATGIDARLCCVLP